MLYNTSRPVVLIIDELESRRISLASTIGGLALALTIGQWTRTEDLGVEAMSPTEIGAAAVQPLDVKLVILSVGGTSLSEPRNREAVSRISEVFPEKPCCLVSDHTVGAEAVMAARLGMHGFVSTRIESISPSKAFNFILAGGTYFPREALLLLGSLNDHLESSPSIRAGEPVELTRRQTQVLERLRLGKSNKLIGQDLNMHESTVKVHLREIMRKLGAANRTQAALLAPSCGPAMPRSRRRIGQNGAGHVAAA